MNPNKKFLTILLCVFLCLFLITDVAFAQEDTADFISETSDEPRESETAADENELSVVESEELPSISEVKHETNEPSVEADPQTNIANPPLIDAAENANARQTSPASPEAQSDYTVNPASAYTEQPNAADAARAAQSTSPKASIICKPIDSKQLTYRIILRNAAIPEGSPVRFAVWSDKNGQDDIFWYTASKIGNDYVAYVNVSNHKTAGKYSVHAYYQTKKGQSKGICVGEFNVAGPTASKVSITHINSDSGTFRVVASNVTAPSGINEVQIPVWCSPDQSDIYWYTAVRHPNTNTWLMDCNIANHRYHTGTYQVHVYATAGNGIRSGVGSVTAKIGGSKGTVSAKATSTAESSYKVTLKGATVPDGCSVKFAVWSNQNGQDDLVWYTASKNGNSYIANIPISNHKSAGKYTVHTYLQMPNGQMSGLSAGSFTVSGLSTRTVKVSKINNDAGTFRITVKAAAPAGVKAVNIAVWSAKDQSDIHWYTATRSGNYYIADANIANHKYNGGTYNIHAYAVLNNGINLITGTTTAKITPTQYIGVEKLGSGEYKVIFRPSDAVNNVNIAVWSEQNGQDDLIWYPALSEGGNNYSVIVSARNHISPGKFICHIYADNNIKGSTEFNIAADEFGTEAERRLSAHEQNVYNAVGRDLYASYCWVKNNFSYLRRAGHISPPAGYTREQWYAVEGFETHRGNCYTFAATFCQLAKGLGYNAQYVEGAVYGYGKWQPHGFVLIYLDGATYICDPELEYASSRGRNLYMQPMSAPKATYRLWQ